MVTATKPKRQEVKTLAMRRLRAKSKAPEKKDMRYSKGAYRLEGKIMTGVNTFLMRHLLEEVDPTQPIFKTFKRGGEIAKPITEIKIELTAGSKSQTRISSYQRSLSGMAKGRYIHRQIEKLTKATTKGSKARRVCVHPVSRLVFRAIEKMNCALADSEVGVYWPQRRIGTQVDLVCRHKKTRLRVLIELKNGYKAGYDDLKYRLKLANHILVSEKERHFLQLLVTTILFSKRFPGHPIGDAILLQVPDHTRALPYAIPDWIVRLRPKIEALISELIH